MSSSMIRSASSRNVRIPCGNRHGAKLLERCPPDDELFDLFGHAQQLVDPDALGVARLRTEVAPGAVGEDVLGLPAPLLVQGHLVGRRLVRLATRHADPAHEALGDDADDRRRDEERLDPHVEETVERGGGIGRVQRRQHEVSRERRLHRDPRRLDVAHLADEDDVGILAQDRLEPAGERDVGLLVDLDLVDRREDVLDRVLDGRDVAVGVVDLAERRVQRRGLPAPGRSRADHHAERRPDEQRELGRASHAACRAGRAGATTGSCRGGAAPPSRPRSWRWSPRARRAGGRRPSPRTGRPGHAAARRCSSRR